MPLVCNTEIRLDFFYEPVLSAKDFNSSVLYFSAINFSLSISKVKVIFEETFNLIYSLALKQSYCLQDLLCFRPEPFPIEFDVQSKL